MRLLQKKQSQLKFKNRDDQLTALPAGLFIFGEFRNGANQWIRCKAGTPYKQTEINWKKKWDGIEGM
jgi:hypothetical protein